MVGRLIENKQVGIGNKYVGKRHAFLLASTQLLHRLLKVMDFQLRKNLLGLEHLLLLAFVVKAGIEHAFIWVEDRRLLKHAHLQVATENDLARVVTFLA